MNNNSKVWLGLFLIAKIVLQLLVINPSYDLHRDEYLHLDIGKHLAWGYQSVPPVTSWISWIIHLLGSSTFLVRLTPALFGALTILVVWKTIRILNGGLYACILGAVAILCSTLLRLNLLYQPNSLDILCWTLSYYWLILYAKTERTSWLYCLGITLAVGFLNKYNIAFLALGSLPALLLSPKRTIFSKPALYAALLLALVMVSPNLFWQYQNDFPVFKHLEELARTQLIHVDRLHFLSEQILFFFSSAYVILAAFISFYRYEPFRQYRFVFWSYWFTLAILMYLKAKPYYAFGLYPVLLAFGAVYLEDILRTGWKRFLKPVALALPAILFFPAIPLIFPLQKAETIAGNSDRRKALGLLRWEDGKDHALPQDFADMLGWKELAHKVDIQYQDLEKTGFTLVLCDNYGQAGAINYYSKFKNIQAVSFNADYIHWFPLGKPIRNLILVKEVGDKDVARNREKPFFEKLELSDSLTTAYARERGTHIFRLKGAQIDVNGFLRQEINRKLNR